MGDKAHENSRLRSLFTRRTWDIKGESFYTCERFEHIYRSRGRYQFRNKLKIKEMEILEAKSEMREKLVREGFKHFFHRHRREGLE